MGDNGGPPPESTIAKNFALLATAFPNAVEIKPSTFTEFYALLDKPAVRSKLPVLTAEAGDTWVYGCSSDPRKMALMRLYMRARREHASSEDPVALLNFSRFLVKASEHTWGSDGRCMEPGSGDTTSWSNEAFGKVRPSHLFKQQEDAWHEQRAYFTHALQALGERSKLRAAIRAGTAALDALGQTSVAAGMVAVPQADWAKDIRLRPAEGEGHGVSLRLSLESGAIVSLVECSSDACDGGFPEPRSWASESQPLGRFVYRSRSHESGVDYYARYQYVNAGWGPRVYEKIGVTSATANETTSLAKVSGMLKNASAMVVGLSPPAFISEIYGGPRKLQLFLSLPSHAAGLQLHMSVIDKTTTRLPEEGWVEFRPNLSSYASLHIEKLGSMVNPADMLVNGSRTLHAVGDEQGVVFTDNASRRRLRLISLDAGLVSPGPAADNMDLYAFPGVLPKPQDGVAFSLWNNLWSVNYVFWYPFTPADASFGFRFALHFESSA